MSVTASAPDATQIPEGATNLDGVLPVTLVSSDHPKNNDVYSTQTQAMLTFTSDKTRVHIGLFSPDEIRSGYVYGSFKVSTSGAGQWKFIDDYVFYVATGELNGSSVTISSPATADYYEITSGEVVRDYTVQYNEDKTEAQVYYCINCQIAPANTWLFSYSFEYTNSAVWVVTYSDITLYSSEYIPDYTKQLENIEGKIDDLINQDAEQHEEVKGLLQRIIETITGIPDKIKEALLNLWNSLVENVTGMFQEQFDSFIDSLSSKLGILWQAPEYFIKVINAICTTDKSNSLTFPSISVPVDGETYVFNEPTEFTVFPDWIPSGVYTFIEVVLSVAVIFGLINYAEKKWDEVMNNG